MRNHDLGVAGLIGLVAVLIASAWLQDPPQGVTQDAGLGRFQGCVDGDTCAWSALKAPVRLIRIDAPEIGEEMYAFDARNALVRKIKAADSVTVRIVCRGKHDRLIAAVYADGVDLSTWMLRHGYADRYTGRVCYD